MLVAQEQYVEAVSMAHKEACEMNGRKSVKDERLRELLKVPHLRRVPRRARAQGSTNSGGEGLMIGSFIGGGGGSVPMPLDPRIQVRVEGRKRRRRVDRGDVDHQERGEKYRQYFILNSSSSTYVSYPRPTAPWRASDSVG